MKLQQLGAEEARKSVLMGMEIVISAAQRCRNEYVEDKMTPEIEAEFKAAYMNLNKGLEWIMAVRDSNDD